MNKIATNNLEIGPIASFITRNPYHIMHMWSTLLKSPAWSVGQQQAKPIYHQLTHRAAQLDLSDQPTTTADSIGFQGPGKWYKKVIG